MKVLVISDTHGNTSGAFSVLSDAEPVDVVIHLGDGNGDANLLRDALDIPVIAVAGNCDSGSSAPRELVWECEGKRILLTHGDAYHVKSGVIRLVQRAQEVGAVAALFGHTHTAVSENHAGVLLVNPGALASYSSLRSYAVLEITPTEISVQHIAL